MKRIVKFQEPDKDEVQPIKIIDDGNGGFNMDLISRREDTQVNLLKESCEGL